MVYTIQCTCCGLIYVGETGACLRARLQQQANPGWSVGQRRRMERIWIDRLNTYVPLGLNAPTCDVF